ncbi:COG1470 family protein [Planctomonas psychrotolerans]|uniref:COG1470 family protein n=1 Tax=Planctomonas psychrotolerans TaxID=2528712 RepID=UPI00123AD53B|nr:hypothetical protein [Planctomonas psychrotolerans]
MHPRPTSPSFPVRRLEGRGRFVVSGVLALALALGGTLAIVLDPAHAATASPVQWSVAPADADGPDGRVSLRHVGDPGQTIDDAIAVTNFGAEPGTFSVLAGDGILGANGAFDIAAAEPEDSGSWIGIAGLDDGQLALAAGETRVLPLSIAIPAEAVPGDHPAGVVVALSRTDDSVTVTNRIGVRVHLQVAGEITTALSVGEATTTFTPSWVPFAPGTVRVEVPVTNEGNVRLGAGVTAELAGPFGIGSTRTSGTLDELLPGDAGTVVLDATAWPAFVVSGNATVTGMTVGEDDVPVPPVQEVRVSSVSIPWTGLAILALLAAVLVAGMLARRRRRRRSVSAAVVTDAGPVSSPEAADIREHETVSRG